ncbi:MAG: tRNA uridine-5-carboxymethylaminomethyl(34) synthesis GTPase MnmE [Sphingomonas fennica]
MTDTIFALSSGPLPAALGVIRISGPQARNALGMLTAVDPKPRQATLARLVDPVDGAMLDEAVVLVFPGPRSVTGEDLVELQCHGGRAVVAGVLEALARIDGLRPAEAGEFTRRAFLSGRIDLIAVEALGDLLTAETALQRRQALRQAEGGLSRRIEQLQAALLGEAASIEASIDYAEEGGETAADEAAIRNRLTGLADELVALLAAPPAERIRDGIRVVLAGPPNAGKSTLLNALAGREAAIVSPIAGTTRDRIEAAVQRDGIAFLLTDTAGLRRTDDIVEQMGLDRAREAIDGADIMLWLGDADPPACEGEILSLHAKCDLGGGKDDRLAVSAHIPATIEGLWRAILVSARRLLPSPDILALTGRQRAGIKSAGEAVGRAAQQQDVVMMAAEVQQAMRAFDRLTGRAGVDEMLAAMFSRFCVGK